MQYEQYACEDCGKIYEDEYWEAIHTDFKDSILNETDDPNAILTAKDLEISYEYEEISEEDFFRLEAIIPVENAVAVYVDEDCQSCVFYRKQDCAWYRDWVHDWHNQGGIVPSYTINLCNDYTENPTP